MTVSLLTCRDTKTNTVLITFLNTTLTDSCFYYLLRYVRDRAGHSGALLLPLFTYYPTDTLIQGLAAVIAVATLI